MQTMLDIAGAITIRDILYALVLALDAIAVAYVAWAVMHWCCKGDS